MPSAGIRSLAVSFPHTVRTNDYWRERHPEMIATAAERTLARVWAPPPGVSLGETAFTTEMAPYMGDMFRGAVARRVLAPGETALSIELPAARWALEAARMGPRDVDLVIASSFLPDEPGIGNAALIAKNLGVRCPAWNIETACSSPLVALEQATAFVRTGAYKRVLVVISCTYSRCTQETDTLSWAVGDGATAYVVTEVPQGQGLLGVKTVNTADKHGAMYYALETDEAGPHVWMRAGKTATASLQEIAESGLVECSKGAAEAAGVSLDDIDFFLVATPVAWFSAFCARRLGFPKDKTISTHALFANTGPVLMPTNLYYAARLGKIRPGSLLMLNTFGVVANVSAAVVRWGEVGLGPTPEGTLAGLR